MKHMMKKTPATLATLVVAFFLLSGCTQKPAQETARDTDAPVQGARAEAERAHEATPSPSALEAAPLPGQTPGTPAAQPSPEQRPGARPAPAKPEAGTGRTGKEPVPAATSPAPTPAPVAEPAKSPPSEEAKPAPAPTPAERPSPAPSSQDAARKPVTPAAKAAVAPDVVILRGAPLGGVRLEHKLHVGYAGNDCATCHHASKPQQPARAPHQACSDCHTKAAAPPMKTTYQAAFHNPTAKSGTCVTCHIAENAKGKKAPVKCVDCHKKENK